MKFKFVLILSFIFTSHYSISQELPMDFSSTLDNFIGFGGSSFAINTDPQNIDNEIGQFFNNGESSNQGFYLDVVNPIDLDFRQTITLSFYSFDPNAHNVVLKLENGANPDVEVRQSFNVPNPSDWITLTFDFSNAEYSSDNTPVSASGIYNRLTIFIDEGSLTPGTYLIDDIEDGTIPTDPNEIDVIYDELVWSDEFDNNGVVDSNNWYHQTQIPIGNGWFNNELQHYTNRIENSFVENGFLNIVAKNEDFFDQGVNKEYTSARLNSKFAFTYGRIDVRAKLPFGNGTWPAIWTLGKNVNENGGFWDTDFGSVNWPACGEIDVMEHGLGAVNHVSSALHTPCDGCSGNTINTESIIISDVANEFHIYSVNWSPNQITFLIDGVGFYTYNPVIKDDNTWPFYTDQFILLNVAMGGFAGEVDATFTESSMLIDYVRVYQNNVLSTDEFALNNVNVYPNPASDFISITSVQPLDFVEMYNLLGQQVLVEKNVVDKININHLDPGVYLLSIYSEGNKLVKKIIVN
jgi:beta-glucanase (GH16 family)